MVTVGVFLMVALPMLAEWRRSMANERALRERGGVEARDDVYALMALAYPGGFLAMIGEGYVRGVSLQSPWLPAGMLVFVAGKALKYWAIAALGRFWSFRVIVVPGAPRVVSGPYRWMNHPNYVGILGELLGVALMTLAWVTGPIAIAVFALLLWRRMAIENAALERLGPGAILRRG